MSPRNASAASLHWLRWMPLACLLLAAAPLGAQETSAWLLSWKDDSYRIEGNRKIPVGTRTFLLTLIPDVGDSVVATLPTANPEVTFVLDGVATATAIDLRSRGADAILRHPGTGASAPGVSVVIIIHLTIDGDEAKGTITDEILGLPGAAVVRQRHTLTARRQP